jgi:keratan sulfate 6-sulfotransferase 1
VIVNILNCRLDQLPINVITDYFTSKWPKSVSLKSYRICLNRNATRAKKNYYTKAKVERCLPLAINSCNNAKIRSIKSIRIGAYMADRLLELDPDLRIIHYMRDPRAMFVSAVKLGYEKYNKTEQWAKLWCYRMYRDHEHLRRLSKGNKILELRYEDLATNFTKILPRMYSYIDRPLPQALIKWFQVNTNATKDNDVLGTSRKNSTITAFMWRSVIPDDVKKIVNRICLNVLNIYHYHY